MESKNGDRVTGGALGEKECEEHGGAVQSERERR